MVWWVRHYGVGSRSSGGHDDDGGDDVPALVDDGDSDDYVGIRNAQIPLMLKLRKNRRTKKLLLLKLGIKVCRIIIESYRHLILYKRR
jgi:hypothetical protein